MLTVMDQKPKCKKVILLSIALTFITFICGGGWYHLLCTFWCISVDFFIFVWILSCIHWTFFFAVKLSMPYCDSVSASSYLIIYDFVVVLICCCRCWVIHFMECHPWVHYAWHLLSPCLYEQSLPSTHVIYSSFIYIVLLSHCFQILFCSVVWKRHFLFAHIF